MAALSATNKATVHVQGNPDIVRMQTTAGTFYKGAIVVFDITNGTVINGTNAALEAGDIFAGICDEDKVTTTADPYLSVMVGATVNLYAAAPALTDCGETVFLSLSGSSDNPADIVVEAAAAAGDIPIGRLMWSDGDNQLVNTADRFFGVVGVT